MRTHRLLVVLLFITGCHLFESEDTLPTVTILRLRGTVTAAATGAPIAGASVALSWGAGAFGTGRNIVFTDSLGAYSLTQDFGGTRFSCNGMGLGAGATGFKGGGYPPGSILCVEDVQLFNFALMQ
jgi:hypothetical protein